MSQDILELERIANHALERSQDAGLALIDLKRQLEVARSEMGCIQNFNRKLLLILKQKYSLHDEELEALFLKTEEADKKLIDLPHQHVAPLCRLCSRPLQERATACIYCGITIATDVAPQDSLDS